MVDITNPGLTPSYEPMDLQQQQTLDAGLTDTSISMPEPEPEPITVPLVQAKLVDGDDLGLSEEEKRKEKEKKKADESANLTSRYLKPRRSFNTSALRDQLSQRLQQSTYQGLNQQPSQTTLSQSIENPQQMDSLSADGFAQPNTTSLPTNIQQGQNVSEQLSDSVMTDGLVTGKTEESVGTDGFMASNPSNSSGQTKPFSTANNTNNTNTPNSLGNSNNSNNLSRPEVAGQTDSFSQAGQPKMTPRQFPSPLGERSSTNLGNVPGSPRQFPSSLGSSSSMPNASTQQSGTQNGRTGGVFSNPLTNPTNAQNQTGLTKGQPLNQQIPANQQSVGSQQSGNQQPLNQQLDQLNSQKLGLQTNNSQNGQMGMPMGIGKGQVLQTNLDPSNATSAGIGKAPESNSTTGMPAQKTALGVRDSSQPGALSQTNTKGAFGTIINKPVSLFGDKSAFSQATFAGSDREQIKMALATKYPVFATLPPNIQNAIAEVFVSQPDLPIETAGTFIQFAETNSFQKLGSNDRATVFKMFGALMQSPLFNNFNDGRIGQLLNDIAGGLVDFQVYRSQTSEPGKSDSTGFALNLSSPEVATALNAALKGDSSQLVNILLNLGKQVPDLQAQDPTWQGLMSQPGFNDLSTGQQEIYQTVKQFPGADAKKLIEYATLPSTKFLAATPNDRTNELKLVAAVNTMTKEGEIKDSTGEASGQPSKTTGSGLRLAGLPAGRLDGSGTTQQIPLDQLVQEGTVNVEIYRANDGKKNIVEGNNIKLNVTDPSVQRSLSTDGKLAAGAVNRFSGVAAQNIDEKIKDLNKTPGFRRLDDNTKRLVAAALKEYPNAETDELLKFSESPNYTDVPPDKSSREKAQMMRMVASLLHQYADNPKQLAMLYSSLQRMFSGDIKFNGFINDSKYASNNQAGGVSINSKWVENEREAAATFVTEVNHALHERPNINWSGTIAFFANQYRSAYTEALFRTNLEPEPEHMRQFISGLLNTQPSSVYAHLRHTLDSDPVFTNLVKWINEKLDDDQVIKPEELRQTLLGMVGKSPNILNEEPFQDSWFVDNESPFPDAAAILAQVSKQLPLDQLSAKEQAIVVNLVRKYESDPQVFLQLMQSPNFQKAEESERSWLLRVIGGLSSEMSKEGKGSPAHRTLNQILGNKIEIKFFESETESKLQYMEKNVLNINLTEGQNLLIDDWVSGLNDGIIESVIGVKK